MLAIFLCFGLIGLIDALPLIRQKDWKNAAAFGILFALALVITVFNQLGTPIPSTILTMDELMHKAGINYK